jgi:hypothetical protein
MFDTYWMEQENSEQIEDEDHGYVFTKDWRNSDWLPSELDCLYCDSSLRIVPTRIRDYFTYCPNEKCKENKGEHHFVRVAKNFNYRLIL